MASIVELRILRDQVKKCYKCLAVKDCSQPVFGIGSASADLMIVGNASTKDDDFMDEPFAGRQGDYLKKLLTDSGINLDKCYFTNAVKCMTDKRKYLEYCKSWLYEEIKLINPKIILTLGQLGGTLFCEKKYNEKIPDHVLGKWNKVWLNNRYIDLVCWYNPKFLLVSGKKKEDKTLSLFQEIKVKLDVNKSSPTP